MKERILREEKTKEGKKESRWRHGEQKENKDGRKGEDIEKIEWRTREGKERMERDWKKDR